MMSLKYFDVTVVLKDIIMLILFGLQFSIYDYMLCINNIAFLNLKVFY